MSDHCNRVPDPDVRPDQADDVEITLRVSAANLAAFREGMDVKRFKLVQLDDRRYALLVWGDNLPPNPVRGRYSNTVDDLFLGGPE